MQGNESIDFMEEDATDFLSNANHPLSQILIEGLNSPSKSRVTNDLSLPLTQWPKIIVKQLPNGFKYVISPNQNPPGRAEVHLEVHAGSKDELENEQGIAHFLEHVVFLGTKKYPTAEKMRNILATWGMSFGPDANAYTDFRSTVYTFQAPISDEPEEQSKELYNIIEVLYELGFESLLPPEAINIERGAVLSELVSSNTMEYRIEYQKFQQVHGNNILSKRFPIGKEDLLKRMNHDDIRAFYRKHYRIDNMTLHICGSVHVDKVEEVIQNIFGKVSKPDTPLAMSIPIELTPPTELVTIFQHELIHQFSLSINVIYPVESLKTLKELQHEMIFSIIELAIDARIYALEQSQSNPPFTSINWEIYDTYREGNRASTYTVSSYVLEWKDAVKTAMEEIHRFVEYGITDEELREHLGTLLKDSHSSAEQNETQDSSDLIEYIMEDINLGNTIMDRKQEYLYQMKIANTITTNQVNDKIRDLFDWFPTLTKKTISSKPYASVFVSCPLKYRKKSVKITKDEVIQVLDDAFKNVSRGIDKHLPEELVEPSIIEEKCKRLNPTWAAAFDKRNPDIRSTKVFDEETGITLLKLSNGIRIQHKVTKFEAKHCTIVLTARGSRSLEEDKEMGALVIGLRTMLSGGAGNFASEQISKYINFNGLSIGVSIGLESLTLELSFSVSHNGMKKALSILHLYLTSPSFDPKAFDRVKKNLLIDCDRQEKELEIISIDNLMRKLLDPIDLRFINPSKKQYDSITLEVARKVVMKQFVPSNLEVNLIGDFEPMLAEDLLLKYLGTLEPAPSPFEQSHRLPLVSVTKENQIISTKIEDDSERCVMLLGMTTVNRYHVVPVEQRINDKQSHPIYLSRIFYVFSKIISNRLFNVVREQKGLTYDINADYGLHDYFNFSSIVISLTPFVDKLEETQQEAIKVMKDIKAKNVKQEELDEVLVPMIKSLRTAINSSNGFWLGMLSNLQEPEIPKDLSTVQKIPEFYERFTLEDIMFVIDKYFHLEPMVISIASTEIKKE